jgi:hypothetical protein
MYVGGDRTHDRRIMSPTYSFPGSPTCASTAAVASSLPRHARVARLPLARSFAAPPVTVSNRSHESGHRLVEIVPRRAVTLRSLKNDNQGPDLRYSPSSSGCSASSCWRWPQAGRWA